jgi:ElaB/YqjD/DUF883 family membrane-anchored ribosome-binding protein
MPDEPSVTVTPPPADPPPADPPLADPPQVVLPEKTPEHLRTIVTQAKLSQEQADTLIKGIQTADLASITSLKQQGQQVLAEWGDAANENLARIRQTLSSLPDNLGKDLAAFLDESGASNHPIVLKALKIMADRNQEGGFLKSGSPAPSAKTLAEKLYPNQGKE